MTRRLPESTAAISGLAALYQHRCHENLVWKKIGGRARKTQVL